VGLLLYRKKEKRRKKERLLLKAENQYSAYAMGCSIEESETITDKGMRFFPIPSALPGHEAQQVSHPMGAGNSFSEGKAPRA
jgi:hypothetical protein